MSKAPDAAHDEHRPDVAMYIKVFGALMLLTLITVAISKLHLPRAQAIGLGLFVATIKAGLVAALFMHLRGESKLIHKALYITVAAAAILVIPMIDFVLVAHTITSPVAVASQHPGGHEESVTVTITLPGAAKPAEKPSAAKGH